MFLNLLLHTDDRTQAYTRCGPLTLDHSLSEAAGKLQAQILFCEKGLFHLIKEKTFLSSNKVLKSCSPHPRPTLMGFLLP